MERLHQELRGAAELGDLGGYPKESLLKGSFKGFLEGVPLKSALKGSFKGLL